MESTQIKDVKSGKVKINAWVHDSRDLGKIRFLILKDSTGIIQVTGLKDKSSKEDFELMKKITRESAISVEGKTQKSKKAPGGIEILPEKIEILGEADQPLSIDTSDFSKTELPKRLDYRFLDFHRRKIQAIFKIQAEILNSFREYFYNKNFLEIVPPSIIGAASEGGTELFPVKYFEKQAYLAQSPQLYKQMIACSIGNTFTITPVWRAEKHNTIRHINESRQMDIEMPFSDQFIVMKELEGCVKHIVTQINKKCKSELDLLEVKLKVPKGIYLHYEEAIKKAGGKVGDDFTPEQEKKLCEKYKGNIIFTHSWPSKIKPFYIMTKDENPKSKDSCGFDALYGGMEISSGGQRIHLPDLLIQRLKDKKLNPKNFKFYIDSFKYGAPPHAGWSIGLERFTQTLLGIENIREVTLFPRDRDRLTP